MPLSKAVSPLLLKMSYSEVNGVGLCRSQLEASVWVYEYERMSYRKTKTCKPTQRPLKKFTLKHIGITLPTFTPTDKKWPLTCDFRHLKWNTSFSLWSFQRLELFITTRYPKFMKWAASQNKAPCPASCCRASHTPWSAPEIDWISILTRKMSAEVHRICISQWRREGVIGVFHSFDNYH